MLSTRCWVVLGPFDIPIDDKVYLRESDAELARGIAQESPVWQTMHAELRLGKRTCVLLYGVTDERVDPESILERCGIPRSLV